jgi:hypothetical protein
VERHALTQALPTRQEAFEGLPNDQFQNFDTYATQFNIHQQPNAFPGPPTPPNQSQHAQQSQGLNGGQLQQADIQAFGKVELSPEEVQAQSRRGGSNSDDDELTPAQSRRKAQNRAA